MQKKEISYDGLSVTQPPCERYTREVRDEDLRINIENWSYWKSSGLRESLGIKGGLCSKIVDFRLQDPDVEIKWDGMYLVLIRRTTNTEGLDKSQVIALIDEMKNELEEIEDNISLGCDYDYELTIYEIRGPVPQGILSENPTEAEKQAKLIFDEFFHKYPKRKNGTVYSIHPHTYFYFGQEDVKDKVYPTNHKPVGIVVWSSQSEYDLFNDYYEEWIFQLDWIRESNMFYQQMNVNERDHYHWWTIKELKWFRNEVDTNFSNVMNELKNKSKSRDERLILAESMSDEIIEFGIEVSGKTKEFEKFEEFIDVLREKVLKKSNFTHRKIFFPLLDFYYTESRECIAKGNQILYGHHRSYMDWLSVINTKYMMLQLSSQISLSENQFEKNRRLVMLTLLIMIFSFYITTIIEAKKYGIGNKREIVLLLYVPFLMMFILILFFMIETRFFETEFFIALSEIRLLDALKSRPSFNHLILIIAILLVMLIPGALYEIFSKKSKTEKILEDSKSKLDDIDTNLTGISGRLDEGCQSERMLVETKCEVMRDVGNQLSKLLKAIRDWISKRFSKKTKNRRS